MTICTGSQQCHGRQRPQASSSLIIREKKIPSAIPCYSLLRMHQDWTPTPLLYTHPRTQGDDCMDAGASLRRGDGVVCDRTQVRRLW